METTAIIQQETDRIEKFLHVLAVHQRSDENGRGGISVGDRGRLVSRTR
jgi:hypothetical protein